jgi:peptidoglycan/xylan/chitin deacetylase (PgdA/CDA1 family)
VLLFHSVCAGACDAADTYGIATADLDALFVGLEGLGYETVSIDDYHRILRGEGAGTPARPILFTFDDGRQDAYQNADPILAAHGARATMFIIANGRDTNPFYMTWDEIVAGSASGRWDIQLHAYAGHVNIKAGLEPDGGAVLGPFYANRLHGAGADNVESFLSWKARTEADLATGVQVLTARVPGFRPVSFAVPYGNFGQVGSNDPDIAPAMRALLDSQFESWFTQPHADPPFATASATTHEAYRYTVFNTTRPADILAWLAKHAPR